MKKIIFGMLCLLVSTSVCAENVLDVYAKAVEHDTTYRSSITAEKISYQDVRLQWAQVLPLLNGSFKPSVVRETSSGSGVEDSFVPAGISFTRRGYTLGLDAKQTVFDASKFLAISQFHALSKQSHAELNAATQDLIFRVANAYFSVLKAQDVKRYSEANARQLDEQLHQTQKQYEVGLKTITDVYTAEAENSQARAELVRAQNDLDLKKENLREITLFYPESLDDLDEEFPMRAPLPNQIDTWVDTALKQNWLIRAKRYAVDAARDNLRVQQSKHLPTVDAVASVVKTQVRTFSESAPVAGASRTVDRSFGLQMNLPLLAGGSVIVSSEKADLQLSLARTELERVTRSTINGTRAGFLSVISNMRAAEAGRRAVKSSASSLDGIRESYNAGVSTILDVLTQQKTLFNAQKDYSSARYDYVISLLGLKKAAGTLSAEDLQIINRWLVKPKRSVAKTFVAKRKHHHRKKK